MIANYKPFLIRKLKDDAQTRDSSEWNIYIKHMPFQLSSEVKNIHTETWVDEQGDNEYVPDTLYYKAYEMTCDFIYIGVHGTANTQIKSFIKYLGDDGLFSIYDTYSKIGRTKVRLVKGDDNPDVFRRRDGNNDIVVFSITLKVNDPITEIILTK